MRVQRIEMQGLFHLYSTRIQFDVERPLVILHGQNGSGKSTLMEMLESVALGNIEALLPIPFDRLAVEFTDDTRFHIQRNGDGGLVFDAFEGTDHVTFTWDTDTSTIPEDIRRLLDVLHVRLLLTDRLENVRMGNQVRRLAGMEGTMRAIQETLTSRHHHSEHSGAHVLEHQLDFFLQVLNRRFRHKRAVISEDQSLVIEMEDGRELPISYLSSGEQHLVVLYGSLIFGTRPGDLVLIDEPELSLHVAWQQGSIQDFLSICAMNEIQVLVATHSPDVIGEWWSLTVPVEENEEARR